MFKYYEKFSSSGLKYQPAKTSIRALRITLGTVTCFDKLIMTPNDRKNQKWHLDLKNY